MSEDEVFSIVWVELGESAFIESFGDDDKSSAIVVEHFYSRSIFINKEKHVPGLWVQSDDVFGTLIEGVKRPPHVGGDFTGKDPHFARW